MLRVGVLTVIDGFSKHRRKVFLFEHCLIFAKIRKTSKSGPTGTEEYEFRHFYRVSVTIQSILAAYLHPHNLRDLGMRLWQVVVVV